MGKQPCDRCVKKNLECVVKYVPKVTVSRDELADNVERLGMMQQILERYIPDMSFDKQSLKDKLEAIEKSPIKETGRPNSQLVDSSSSSFFDNIGNNNNFLAQLQVVLPSNTEISDNHGLEEYLSGYKYTTDSAIRVAVGALPAKEECLEILSAFLKVAANNNYFYYHEEEFLIKVEDLYERSNKVTHADNDFVCILLLSLAVGSLFMYVFHGNGLLKTRDRNVFPGSTFYCAAKILSSSMVAKSNIDSVVAFLLMTIYLLCSTLPLNSSYAYSGVALRAAVSNNLHRANSESLNRLFWSVYCLERRLAISLGRPETLPLSDISTPLPAYDITLDNSDNMAQVSTLSLATTISLVSFKIYDVWALVCKNKTGLSFSTISELMQNLENWRKEFPPSLELGINLTPSSRGYRGICHIMFQYHMARLALGRPFLLWKLRQQKIDPLIARLASKLTRSCLHAAVDILDTLDSMRKSNKLSLFSYLDYISCHSAAIVLVGYFLVDPSETALKYLAQAIEIMSQYADHCPWTIENLKLVLSLKASLESTPQYVEWCKISHHREHCSSSSESYPPSLTGGIDYDTTAMDAQLNGLAGSDFFNSIIADSSFSFIQNSSIEGLLFPQ